MRFKARSAHKLPKSQLEADHTAAKVIGRLSLGEDCIYIKGFLSCAYLPYADIQRAWLRQETIPSGKVEFYQFFLIVQDLSGKAHWCAVPSYEVGNEILAQLESRNPKLKLGYQEQE